MIYFLLLKLMYGLLGTFYPVYASFIAMKTVNTKDYIKWMEYWIVYALYSFIEVFLDFLFAFWFPFYYEMKVLFAIWLISPVTRGSRCIFRSIIVPNFPKYEAFINLYIDSLSKQCWEICKVVGVQALQLLGELLHKSETSVGKRLPKVNTIFQSLCKILQQEEKNSKETKADDSDIYEEGSDISILGKDGSERKITDGSDIAEESDMSIIEKPSTRKRHDQLRASNFVKRYQDCIDNPSWKCVLDRGKSNAKICCRKSKGIVKSKNVLKPKLIALDSRAYISRLS
ncbi:uncharacterized protein T19C3.4-like [Stegodyphus dumicola]|uniref:uncharacterized protein T19C3.4-like n=1 Tax=Stegodyphus dumicola TaxID=202533 RepID=UPI0015A9FAD1|nr:uncharacterized protein T19C3.4-like [Stegodyphus dumicola]